MNQGFWMAKDSECLNDGEMSYDHSSRTEPKRSRQWFMDGPEADLFPNKKQTVDVPNNGLLSGLINSHVPQWSNASSFHSISGQFGERLLDSETARSLNYDNRNIQSVGAEKVNAGRKLNEDIYGNDPSFGLSMSHQLEDPSLALNYGGFRKAKVSQLKDSGNVMSTSLGQAFDRGDNNSMSMGRSYEKADGNSVSTGLAYNKGDENLLSMPETYDSENSIFISMGQPYTREDGRLISTYKENNNTMAVGQSFSKGDSSIISMGQGCNKAEDRYIPAGNIYNKGDKNVAPMDNTYGGDNSSSMSRPFSKEDSTIISFGGYSDDDDTNPSGRILPGYEFLAGQGFDQRTEIPGQKNSAKSNADALGSHGSHVSSSNIEVLKKKEESKASKKVPPNSFPSNVRSLLSTGMLDGVGVKYTAWSREKELSGVIKGSGYQCGCQSCNYSKVINAYEFERHAGCKTKHPNNHIYFENGKTIYGIVQELRSTPQNMLFEVIQTITGSPINQKAFRLWKESFLAATRELQRIYGKDDTNQLL